MRLSVRPSLGNDNNMLCCVFLDTLRVFFVLLLIYFNERLHNALTYSNDMGLFGIGRWLI